MLILGWIMDEEEDLVEIGEMEEASEIGREIILETEKALGTEMQMGLEEETGILGIDFSF